MVVKEKNQNYIMNKDLINSFEIDYIFDSKPIKRYKNKPTIENINSNLQNLKSKILNINNCELKKNAKQIVFYNYVLQNVNGPSSDLTLSEFTNVKLKDANFNHAKIGGIHFINSNLDDVSFNNTDCNEMIPGTGDYYPCIFENVFADYITGEYLNWKNVYILDTFMDNASFIGSIFSDLTILNSVVRMDLSILNNISVTNSDVYLNVSDFFISDLEFGIIKNANFENSKIQIDTDDTNISEITTSKSFIIIDSSDGIFENVVIDNTTVGIRLSNMEINNLRISDAVPRSHTSTCLAIFVCFFDPDGPLTDTYDNSIDVSWGSMNRIIIENSDIDSLSVSSSEMDNVIIRNSEIDFLRISSVEMDNVKIIDSVIDRANFEYVDLSTVDLSGTEIDRGTFTGVTTGDTPLGCTGHPICD